MASGGGAGASGGGGAFPKLIAFDLDETLWRPEMYMCAGPPFTSKNGRCYDSAGTEIKLHAGCADILARLATEQQCKVAYVSRTYYPEYSAQCLDGIHVGNGLTMRDCAQHFEIYPADKKKHFRAIEKASGVSCCDMLFFDDQERNCSSVRQLGATSVLVPNGLTPQNFAEGLRQYAANKQ